MKVTIQNIFNRPWLVAIASILIAGIIAQPYFKNSNSPAAFSSTHTVRAVSGDIALGNAPAGVPTNQNLTLAFSLGGQIKEVKVAVDQTVKAGEVLASLDPQDTLGKLTQARAAYDAAIANYQRVVNGATSPTIEVAKAALNTAQIAHDEAVQQQEILVENAYTSLLNSTLEAYPQDAEEVIEQPPRITGSYLMGKEGQIIVETYRSNADSGYSLRVSGLVSGPAVASTITPQPIINSGLYIQFPNGIRRAETWIIAIPNTKAPDYINKYNAYQSALRTKEQVLSNTKAVVEQAETNLNAVVASARPEDIAAAEAQVESARGAMQIAQSSFDMRKIIAPVDGVITAVRITAGQTIGATVAAIEMKTSETHKKVSVMVPSEAISEKDGVYFVTISNGGETEMRQVSVGIHDATNTEILSGLSVNEEIVIENLLNTDKINL